MPIDDNRFREALTDIPINIKKVESKKAKTAPAAVMVGGGYHYDCSYSM